VTSLSNRRQHRCYHYQTGERCSGRDPQSIVTDEDTPTIITLSSSDVEGDALTFAILKRSESRRVERNCSQSRFTCQAANFNGIDSITFKANDGTPNSLPATISIIINPVNDAPAVNVGPNQTITFPATATLSGSVSDVDSSTGSIVTIVWSKVSGPGAVTFAPLNSPNSTATFSEPGSYVLRLTGNVLRSSAAPMSP
jgi:hypothetical protein